MELLSKRPLAIGCLLFIFLSLVAGYIPAFFSFLGMLLAVLLAAVIFGVPVLRRRCFGLGLCLCIAAAALCHSYVLTDLPRQKAENAEGRRTVFCRVLEADRSSEESTTVTVRILKADDQELQVKGRLYFEDRVELSVGDQVKLLAAVELYESGTDRWIASRKDSGGILLSLYAEEPSEVYVQRLSENLTAAWNESPIVACMVAADRGKMAIRERLHQLLGEKIGSLALGFLVGDTEEIAPSVLRDFRRTGVYHILSVSGLHLTVLLGAVDLFLQKLRVVKKGRIPVICVLGICLLALTGFAESACRSVLMLLLLYIQFMVAEEYDNITALFVSAVLIVLFSPYAVNDLGFWMSFQATLALLTVVPLWDRKSQRSSQDSRPRWLRRLGASILSVLLLTVAANLFLVPIFWAAFGEISWICLVCNLLIAPLSSIFLISIPIVLALGSVPWIGEGLSYAVGALGEGIVWVTGQFSSVRGGTVSLKYDFCPWIILPLTAGMILLLLIRLRHKWLFAALPAAAAVSFCFCLVGYGLWFSMPEVAYVTGQSRGETLCVRENQRLVICDLSGGGYRGSLGVQDALQDSLATEIECLIFTDVSRSHVSMMEMVSQEQILRRICLPVPTSAEEEEYGAQMKALARKQGVEVVEYSTGNGFFFSEECRLWIAPSDSGGRTVTVCSAEKEVLCLAGSLQDSSDVEKRMARAEVTIFSKSAACPSGISLPEHAKTETVVFGSYGVGQRIALDGFSQNKWIPAKERTRVCISFSLTEKGNDVKS